MISKWNLKNPKFKIKIKNVSLNLSALGNLPVSTDSTVQCLLTSTYSVAAVLILYPHISPLPLLLSYTCPLWGKYLSCSFGRVFKRWHNLSTWLANNDGVEYWFLKILSLCISKAPDRLNGATWLLRHHTGCCIWFSGFHVCVSLSWS